MYSIKLKMFIRSVSDSFCLIIERKSIERYFLDGFAMFADSKLFLTID